MIDKDKVRPIVIKPLVEKMSKELIKKLKLGSFSEMVRYLINKEYEEQKNN